jgi:hypothetical protein
MRFAAAPHDGSGAHNTWVPDTGGHAAAPGAHLPSGDMMGSSSHPQIPSHSPMYPETFSEWAFVGGAGELGAGTAGHSGSTFLEGGRGGAFEAWGAGPPEAGWNTNGASLARLAPNRPAGDGSISRKRSRAKPPAPAPPPPPPAPPPNHPGSPPGGDRGDPPKARGAIRFETACRILSPFPGGMPQLQPRPHRLLDLIEGGEDTLAREGALFLDDGARRQNQGDRWVMMGGPRGTTISQQHGVQRSYGSLKLHNSNVQARFHVYKLHKPDGTKNGPTGPLQKLWHVLPADSATPSVGKPPQPSPSTVVEYPLRTHRRKANWSPAYLDFENSEGRWQGSIGQAASGAKFLSRSGDFAEWCRRRPDEAPFEQGDVVGFDEAGLLTRRTASLRCSQMGIISRVAAVEGSVPDKAHRDQYDIVAFTGIVPVKLRGSCEAGQYIVPSGREDGTAMAVSRFSAALTTVLHGSEMPTVRLGRAMRTMRRSPLRKGSSSGARASLRCFGFGMHDMFGDGMCGRGRGRGGDGELLGAEWQLVDVAVVNPVDTVSGRRPWVLFWLVLLGTLSFLAYRGVL